MAVAHLTDRLCTATHGSFGSQWCAFDAHAHAHAPRAPVCALMRQVHMVRDPVRWAISYYDYHRAVPTPESWVTLKRPSCEPAHAEHAGALGLDVKTMNAAIAACVALVRPNYTCLPAQA